MDECFACVQVFRLTPDAKLYNVGTNLCLASDRDEPGSPVTPVRCDDGSRMLHGLWALSETEGPLTNLHHLSSGLCLAPSDTSLLHLTTCTTIEQAVWSKDTLQGTTETTILISNGMFLYSVLSHSQRLMKLVLSVTKCNWY